MSNSIKARILLAEDDENLGFILQDYLEISKYTVSWQKNGKMAVETFRSQQFEICILDVMMPVMDGFTAAKEIRKINPDIPLIFLTAKSMKEDKILGLTIGADDYITKPFSTEELGLRIDAILRRYFKSARKETGETVFDIGIFKFDSVNQILSSEGEDKRLTKKESEVLRMLCNYRGELLKRDIALKEIWGEDDYFMGRSMDVYITKLRKYLKEDNRITIKNIHGTGFMLEVSD